MAAIQDATLVVQALRMALARRRPQAGLLHHSDRGSTYTSESYQQLLAQEGKVAKNLGSSHGSLFKQFPELCRAIATRYLDALKKQRIERVQKLCNEVHQATLSIHTQEIYPSSNKVFALVNNKWAMHESKAYATWKTTLEELGCYYQP